MATPALYVISVIQARDLPVNTPRIEIRLHSDSASRQIPFPSAMSLARLTRTYDFHL